MKPNQKFLNKHDVGSSQEYWTVDSVGKCGKIRFEKVVVVVDPRSTNPGVIVAKPFGLNGLKACIAMIEAERAKELQG